MTDRTPDAVALPERGDGSRSARRGGSGPPPRPPRVPGPRRSLPLPLPWLLGGLAALVVAVLAVVALTGDDDAPDEETVAATTPAAEDRATGMVVVRDDSGALVALTLVLGNGDLPGGDLVHVPPGTMVEVPSLGLVPLRDAAAQSGDLLTAAVENALGERLDDVAELDPVDLAEALAPAGSFEVEVPAEVERRVGDRIETVFPAGRILLSPSDALELLSAPARTDLDRLVRHQAFWTGWLEVMREDESASPSRLTLGLLADRIARIADGEVVHHVLPVVAVDAADQLYRVDERALADLLRRLLPGTPPPGERVAVQVLNGTGAPGVGQALVAPLVEVGAKVALTGNADRFDHATTQIVYYDDALAEEAERLREAIGVGEVVKSRARIDAVDVTIVVGADLPVGAAGTTTTPSEGATP